jgi:hypothetical protein
MSDEQRQITIGRTVLDFVERKKRLAALQADAVKIGSILQQIGQQVHGAGQWNTPTGTNIMAVITQSVGEFPTGQSLLDTVNQINSELSQVNQLRQSLRKMGIDPKEE